MLKNALCDAQNFFIKLVKLVVFIIDYNIGRKSVK